MKSREGKGEWNVGKRWEEEWRKIQDLVTDWKMGWRKRSTRVYTSAPGGISVNRRKSVFNFCITTSSLEENYFYLHSTDRRIQISQTYASLLWYRVLQLSETERGGRTYVFRKETNPGAGGVGSNHSRQKWWFSWKLLEGRDNVFYFALLGPLVRRWAMTMAARGGEFQTPLNQGVWAWVKS